MNEYEQARLLILGQLSLASEAERAEVNSYMTKFRDDAAKSDAAKVALTLVVLEEMAK